MKENSKNVGKVSSQLMSRFGADKKKAISALCLIAIMVFMWIRVLGGKGPQNAEAEIAGTQQEVTGTNKTTALTFIELPVVKGRNDMLTKDFFTINQKDLSNYSNVSSVSPDANEDVLGGIKNKIKLEAISMGNKPQAFINSKLLSEGEKLKIEDGINSYEFEVSKIEENRVIMKSKDAEVILSLSQRLEVLN